MREAMQHRPPITACSETPHVWRHQQCTACKVEIALPNIPATRHSSHVACRFGAPHGFDQYHYSSWHEKVRSAFWCRRFVSCCRFVGAVAGSRPCADIRCSCLSSHAQRRGAFLNVRALLERLNHNLEVRQWRSPAASAMSSKSRSLTSRSPTADP